MRKDYDAIIVGGGFSGLATAALLANDGKKVLLLEKNNTLGGRARVLKTKGFTFDMGPSWYLMPEVFERFFNFFNKKPSDYYQLEKLDPAFTAYFDDGIKMQIPGSFSEIKKVFNKIEKGSGDKLQSYMHLIENLYKLAVGKLLYKDTTDIKTWLDLKFIFHALHFFVLMHSFQSWDSVTKRYFKNSKLRKLMDFSAVFLGGSPLTTPVFYSIVNFNIYKQGVYYPMGGMGKIVDGIESIAREKNVEIRKNEEVEKILVRDGKVLGVKTLRNEYYAKSVIVSSDLLHAERELIPKKYQTFSAQNVRKKSLAISALLIYLGIDKKTNSISHHSLILGNAWEKSFDEIFKKKVWPTDPSVYVSARSVTDKSLVPKNSTELVILVPVPSGTKHGTDISKYTRNVLSKVEHAFGIDFSSDIVFEKTFTVKDFEKDYNAYQGTALGMTHTLGQSLFLRPGVKSKKVKGLFYTGQYTQPGVGVPMALISAEIAYNKIHEFLQNK